MDKNALILKLVDEWANPPVITDSYITVAEILSVESQNQVKIIDTNTAILSRGLIARINPAECHPFVETTGAWHKKHDKYRPKFWLNISPGNGLNRAEPLAIASSIGNHTTLMPDQGFLSAMGLTAKALQDEISWDDLSRPRYDVVKKCTNKSLCVSTLRKNSLCKN